MSAISYRTCLVTNKLCTLHTHTHTYCMYVFSVILAIDSDSFYILHYHGLVMGTQYVYCEVETDFFYCNRMKSRSGSGAGPGFVGPEVYTIFGPLFLMKNNEKITTTHLGTKVNICLGPLPGPFKGPVQVRDFKLKHNQLHGKSAPVPDICRWSLVGEAPFQSQCFPSETYGILCGTGTGLYPSTSAFPCQYHSTKTTNTFINITLILHQGVQNFTKNMVTSKFLTSKL